jgi:hypothetical protein
MNSYEAGYPHQDVGFDTASSQNLGHQSWFLFAGHEEK